MALQLAAAAVAPVLALAATMASTAPAAAAVGFTAPAVSVSVASAPDFATETLSDPWDFSNREDALLSHAGPMLNVANQQIDNGRLSYDSTGNSHYSPVWGGYPGSQYTDRDGAIKPVDASRYSRLCFRMYSSQTVGGRSDVVHL